MIQVHVLHVCIADARVIPPFRPVGKFNDLLVVSKTNKWVYMAVFIKLLETRYFRFQIHNMYHGINMFRMIVGKYVVLITCKFVCQQILIKLKYFFSFKNSDKGVFFIHKIFNMYMYQKLTQPNPLYTIIHVPFTCWPCKQKNNNLQVFICFCILIFCRKADVKMLKMTKVLNMEMDKDELRNDDFRYGILNTGKHKTACALLQ